MPIGFLRIAALDRSLRSRGREVDREDNIVI